MRRSFRALLVSGAVVAVLAACAEQNPAGLGSGPPGPPPVQAALQCQMDVRSETLTCTPVSAAPGVTATIIGGQGTNVRLTSSGTSYDGATGILRTDVTVQNLMAQALGTADGAFPAPEGVRVFFHTGPTVTEGSGSVTVANADGEGVFTAAGQKYFQYAGLLAPGATSAAREWRFDVPLTATHFVFSVYVAAAVPGPQVPPAAVVLLAGAGITDTVDATPATPLRIGVRGADGKPAVGAFVEVDAVGLPSDLEVAVVGGGSVALGNIGYATTDSLGIAEFQVQMGKRARVGRLVVMAPGLGLADTARFTILPGNVAQVRSLPEDTTVLLGARVPLHSAVFDRHGNPRSDSVTFAIAGGPGTLQGREVATSASSIGLVTVTATSAGVTGNTLVRVVPPGTVAVPTGGSTSRLYLLSLDGTSIQQVASPAGQSSFGVNVSWLSHTRLIYDTSPEATLTQLRVLDLGTGTASTFLPEADHTDREHGARVSRDGVWVYFDGGVYYRYKLFRAHADGTGKQSLSDSPDSPQNESDVDPSPDGARIVYVHEGLIGQPELAIGTLASGQMHEIGVQGLSPRWSPDGTRVAFLAATHVADFGGPVTVMNADGTGARTLSSTRIDGNIDWSPDGKYIIGAGSYYNQLVIIEAATGNEVSVRYPVDLFQAWLISPAWRP